MSEHFVNMAYLKLCYINILPLCWLSDARRPILKVLAHYFEGPLFRRLGLLSVGLGLGLGLGLVGLGLVRLWSVGLGLRITPSEYQTFEIVDLWTAIILDITSIASQKSTILFCVLYFEGNGTSSGI